MDKKKRLVLTTGQKILLWIAGLLLVWQLFQNETVVNAILAFCFAGAVPGTHVVLSPDAIMRIVAAVLGFGIVVLLLKLVLTELKRRRSFSSIEPSVAAPTLRQSIATQPSTKDPRLNKIKIPNMSSLGPFATGVRANNSWLKRDAQKAATMLRSTLRVFGLRCVTALAFTGSASKQLGRLIVRSCRVAWQRISPFLWQLDSWLALQTHRARDWAADRLNSHEAVRIMLDIGRTYKKSARGLQPKAIQASMKQQFNKLKNELYHMLKSKA